MRAGAEESSREMWRVEGCENREDRDTDAGVGYVIQDRDFSTPWTCSTQDICLCYLHRVVFLVPFLDLYFQHGRPFTPREMLARNCD